MKKNPQTKGIQHRRARGTKKTSAPQKKALQNDSNKLTPINNYTECKWHKCTHKETESDRMDKKTGSINMLSTRDTP